MTRKTNTSGNELCFSAWRWVFVMFENSFIVIQENINSVLRMPSEAVLRKLLDFYFSPIRYNMLLSCRSNPRWNYSSSVFNLYFSIRKSPHFNCKYWPNHITQPSLHTLLYNLLCDLPIFFSFKVSHTKLEYCERVLKLMLADTHEARYIKPAGAGSWSWQCSVLASFRDTFCRNWRTHDQQMCALPTF